MGVVAQGQAKVAEAAASRTSVPCSERAIPLLLHRAHAAIT